MAAELGLVGRRDYVRASGDRFACDVGQSRARGGLSERSILGDDLDP